MEWLSDYIKQRRSALILFIVCVFILGSSFALYHLPLKAVLYPVTLCLVLLVLVLILDCRKCYCKYQEMQRYEELPDNLLEFLGKYEGIEDRSYTRIIENLLRRENKARGMTEDKVADMVDYYATWGHQIKTPIASMKVTLQNQDTPLARKVSEDLFRIEQYVEMVLTYLRLDSDSTDYVFRECDLDSVIKQSLRKFAGQFISKGIRMEFVPTEQKLVTDEKWFAFVIEQILSNAVKYTPEGSVKICLREPDLLCISDTGIGIAQEDIPRIFEKGYTGYNGRSDKKASGLGLYLCYRICTRLGIDISVESEIEKGTTICLNLKQNKANVE